MFPSDEIICLVDDEPSVLKALGRLLASEGIQAQKFSEPRQFLEHARHHPVRLAVIDVCMPGLSGFEVVEELRTSSPDARVIMMTGERHPDHRNAAMSGGVREFFLKPFDDESFLQAVREAPAS